ncbi:MAG: sugar phosphate isomerase/epimerase [Planctomycetales bacterium]|nr:sugar phosphate isomerase/epimerase [Planctomycetales bacterium]
MRHPKSSCNSIASPFDGDRSTTAQSQSMPRRVFVQSVAAVAAGVALAPHTASAAANESAGSLPAGSILKSVKFGMIEGPSDVLGKFQLCQELGFDGMELISPFDVAAAEIRRASDATQMPVHGVVDMKHWEIRLSSPDPKVREQGREILIQAIKDAASFGGHTVLLVPGAVRGADETHDDVWKRSIPEIRLAVPTASRLGVRILIENVWNGFCETPEQLRDYLDEIDSPWVGSYFDIGNVRKFGPSEDWIQTLGSRIVKLDVKDWGKSNGFCKIGDGDVNWPAVRKALGAIGYRGWSTAEVAGGPRERLADIKARMDRVLG